MKLILLMTDFSDNAKNAIKYGIEMFGENVEYLLFNSYVVRENSGSFMSMSDKIMEISEEELKKELEYTLSSFPQYSNLKITPLLGRGGPVDGIAALKKQYPIDLIIMGTKGASGLTKLLVGSVTTSVVKNTELPVLMIPAKVQFSPLKKLVFSSDFPNKVNKEVLLPMVQLVEKFEAELSLLNVLVASSEKSEIQKELELLQTSSFEKLNTKIALVEGDSVSLAIENYCKNNNIDLLTVVSHHNKFFDNLFHKSVSKELLFHANLPILALDDSFKD